MGYTVSGLHIKVDDLWRATFFFLPEICQKGGMSSRHLTRVARRVAGNFMFSMQDMSSEPWEIDADKGKDERCNDCMC